MIPMLEIDLRKKALTSDTDNEKLKHLKAVLQREALEHNDEEIIDYRN